LAWRSARTGRRLPAAVCCHGACPPFVSRRRVSGRVLKAALIPGPTSHGRSPAAGLLILEALYLPPSRYSSRRQIKEARLCGGLQAPRIAHAECAQRAAVIQAHGGDTKKSGEQLVAAMLACSTTEVPLSLRDVTYIRPGAPRGKGIEANRRGPTDVFKIYVLFFPRVQNITPGRVTSLAYRPFR